MSDDIKILIVDDHLVVRRGLAHVLDSADGVSVVGEAASGEEAIFLAQKLVPDVVFMDLKMAGMGGVEATRIIAQAGSATGVVGLSTFFEPEHITAMRNAGAKGFVSKEAVAADIVGAARAIVEGNTCFPEGVATEDGDRTSAAGGGQHLLGNQQRRVLALMIKGLTNPEIAEQLDVSRPTVSYHVSAILRKLDVSNRAEAVALAVREGIVGADDL